MGSIKGRTNETTRVFPIDLIVNICLNNELSHVLQLGLQGFNLHATAFNRIKLQSITVE